MLGLMFEETCSTELKQNLSHYMNCCCWYDYKYTWFLACLYHDIASTVERQRIPPNPSEQQKQLLHHLGNLDICYSPFAHKSFSRLYPVNSIMHYSEALVHNYFYYRASCGECDHGIIGGYYLFDRLYKNYLENTKNGVSTDKFLRLPAHIDHFTYICDAIICHNLWTVKAFNISDENREKNEKDQETYRQYGLSPLILSQESDRLQFSEHPLQFILCLTDTIEPSKRFLEKNSNASNLTTKLVLESINVHVELDKNSNKHRITIEWEDSVSSWCGFDEWHKGICGMKDWLAIYMDSESTDQANQIIIQF